MARISGACLTEKQMLALQPAAESATTLADALWLAARRSAREWPISGGSPRGDELIEDRALPSAHNSTPSVGRAGWDARGAAIMRGSAGAAHHGLRSPIAGDAVRAKRPDDVGERRSRRAA